MSSHATDQAATTTRRPDTVRLDGRDTKIAPDGLTVGRGEDCDIQLDTPRASRHHARIFLDDTGSWVEDLGSTNGTFLNGEPVHDERRSLANGDLVRIDDQELLVLAGEKTTYQGGQGASARPVPQGGITTVELTQQPLTIGRDPANVLTLDDPNVSRFHAVIKRSAAKVELRDLGSLNGTRVNGQPVSRAVLSEGAELAIGAYRLTFTGTSLIPRDERRALRLESKALAMNVGGTALLAPTSLAVEPGELVAIIGESGAGKTTLLKALAGITRPTQGEVLLGGEPVTRRLTDVGYVPQDDIVHRLLTVREALRYAATLRLPPDTSDAELDGAVGRVLSQLELEPHAHKLVRNISGGQRKRVGVAVELLSRPGILFLDEPATGLDPGLEKKLMELLRELSDESRPVVTITHSTKQLHLCDKLMVMGRGGILCFFGPPDEALTFFGVEDFDDIYTALDESPAERWLDDPRRLAMYPPPSNATGLMQRSAREQAPPVLPQAAVLARRYRTLLLRDRRNLAILLGQVPILALLIAIGFSSNIFNPAGGRVNAPTFLFVTTITTVWLGSIAAAREIVKERSVFLRERAAGVSVSAYLISKVVVLFVLCAAQVAILAAILFVLRPLHTSGSGYALVVLLLLVTSLASIGMGLAVSTLARSEDQSTSFIPVLLIPQLLFGGSLIPLVGKGVGIKLLSALMPARWAFAGLGAAVHLGTPKDPGINPVVRHYGSFFSQSGGLMAVLVAAFAAAFLAIVAYRLQAQTD